MLKSWRTTIIGFITLAVGSYYALTGGGGAITALFLTSAAGCILAKDSNAKD